jgi:magnesium-transporting ATPase (P-type)
LDVLEFTSKRKRMSVIMRDSQTNKLILWCKGADSVIYSKLRKEFIDGDGPEKDLADRTTEHITTFAADGLRTLALAKKNVDEGFYNDWKTRFDAALENPEELKKKREAEHNEIDRLMDEIELDMELLGATAIEDKLQRGVPDTIARLARAGVSIWVLTGDKEETAVNIGFACQLLNRSMRRMHFNGKYVGGPDRGKLKTGAVLKAEILKAYRGIQSIPEAERNIQSLVIDGAALELVFPNSNDITPEACCDDASLEESGSLRNCVLALANLCKAVVACRVSPKQKSLMVNLIKINTKGIKTLAIGDGANDVPMIQAAHVGVGISGQEGMQAVNASDFAIGQVCY